MDEIVIPKEILEIEKQIRETKTPDELNSIRQIIIAKTAWNAETFSHIQKVFIKQKRKLGMKCDAGKKLTI